MSNRTELKQITKARLRSVETLIKAKDWHGAAYLLGYVLECALKAATCKTLHLVSYPDGTKNPNVSSYFMTHKFEQLLVVSGLENIFSSRGPTKAWQNWSSFTIEYPGDWPIMRYDAKKIWDEIKVKKLFSNITEPKYGILSIIKDQRKW